jgi:hypothetical protein
MQSFVQDVTYKPNQILKSRADIDYYPNGIFLKVSGKVVADNKI